MKNPKILFWSLVSALAGFLFGFDTVVISGAEQTLQEIWSLSDGLHGTVVVGTALLGTVIGAIFGSIPTNLLGRKTTLIYIGVFYIISAIGSALANDPYLFGAFRFLGGLGVGVSTIAAPVYISEIAPAKNRGKLVGLYQFNIVFGILIAYLSNFLIDTYILIESWRWMLGIEAFPALIYCLLVFYVPKSPRWLLLQGKDIQAIETLSVVDPETNIEELRQSIEQSAKSKLEGNSNESIFSKTYSFPLMLTFFIAFFNQFSGINAFLYYAKRIFEEGGLAQEAAYIGTIGVGLINLLFTLIGITLIDKIGRRKLLFTGSIGYIISLTLVGLSFLIELNSNYLPYFFFLFIAAHAIGSGTIIWVYISEIFPNHLRGYGQSFGSSVHWILAWLIPSSIPILFSLIGAGVVFLIFAVMMFLQLIFVIKVMPETKGIALEKISASLRK